MRKVLVLDANQRSGLAIIRSLGRQGLEVVAGDHVAQSLGGASRYAHGCVRYPNPATSPGHFVQEVCRIAEELAVDTIVPATDLTTMLLVSQSNLPKNLHLAAPGAESYETLTDKARLVALATKLGIRVPKTRVVGTAEEIVASVPDLGFPLVLKPARSRYLNGDEVLSTSVEIVRNAESLPSVLLSLPWLGAVPCLVQQYVPGGGAGVFALHGPSGTVAWFAHRRIREKPPTGGVSVLSESVPIDPIMRMATEKLLAAVGWTGVAMVEFRVAPDGTAYLMEVNGRFWGSLQLSIDCGVDFPWLLYELTHGHSIQHPPHYLIGRRLRWLLGDLDSLLIDLKSHQSGLGRKVAAVSAFARSFMDLSCRQEVLRLHDPRPGVEEVRRWIRSLLTGS